MFIMMYSSVERASGTNGRFGKEALNHVQAPGRIQDRRDMRGLNP
jgi:hypothetical protein